MNCQICFTKISGLYCMNYFFKIQNWAISVATDIRLFLKITLYNRNSQICLVRMVWNMICSNLQAIFLKMHAVKYHVLLLLILFFQIANTVARIDCYCFKSDRTRWQHCLKHFHKDVRVIRLFVISRWRDNIVSTGPEFRTHGTPQASH